MKKCEFKSFASETLQCKKGHGQNLWVDVESQNVNWNNWCEFYGLPVFHMQ